MFILVQISENSGKLSDDFKNFNKQITWSAIKGLLNRLVHLTKIYLLQNTRLHTLKFIKISYKMQFHIKCDKIGKKVPKKTEKSPFSLRKRAF